MPKRLPLLSIDEAGIGVAPLVPLNEARVVMVPLPGDLEDRAVAARAAAVGRAEEIAAAVHRPGRRGDAPLAAVERGQGGDGAAAVGDLEDRAVAERAAPVVVPKRLPLLSTISADMGLYPLVPLNEARVVIVLLPSAISKTVPSWSAASIVVVPKRLPLLSIEQAGLACPAIGAVKRGQRWTGRRTA